MLAGTIPFVPSVGVALNITPPHVVVLIAVIDGFGYNVTVNVNVLLLQLASGGITVTVYVAVCTELVSLTNVPNIPNCSPADP
jgi:hypothetical protein